MSASKKWISEYRKKYPAYDYDMDSEVRRTLSGSIPKNQNFSQSKRIRSLREASKHFPQKIEPTFYGTEYSDEYISRRPQTDDPDRRFRRRDQAGIMSWNSNQLNESTYHHDYTEDHTTLAARRRTPEPQVAGLPRNPHDPNDHRLQRLESISDSNPFDLKVRGDVPGTEETTYIDHYRDFYNTGEAKPHVDTASFFNSEDENLSAPIRSVEKIENSNPFDIQIRGPVPSNLQTVYQRDFCDRKKPGPRSIRTAEPKARSITLPKLYHIEHAFPFEIGTPDRSQADISTIYQDNYVNHPRYETMRKLDD